MSVIDFDVRDGTIATVRANYTEPGELRVRPPHGGGGSVRVNGWLRRERQLERPQASGFRYPPGHATKNPLGTVFGTYLRPWASSAHDTAPTPRGTIPVVFIVKGGPYSNFGENFGYEAHVIAGMGAGVARFNLRGSSGYGEAFADAAAGDAGAEAEDLYLAITGTLEQRPELDPTRVALIGISNGATAVAHVAARHPDLIRTVVFQRPVLNLYSRYWGSDDARSARYAADDPAAHGDHPRGTYTTPTADGHDLLRRSATQVIAGMTSGKFPPTLIIYGDRDHRTLTSQGYELQGVLLSKGTPCSLWLIRGAGHGVVQAGNRRQLRTHHGITADWLAHRLRLPAPRGSVPSAPGRLVVPRRPVNQVKRTTQPRLPPRS